MKRISILLLALIMVRFGNAQHSLTLKECYERAEQNYPLIRQRDLIEKVRAYSIENVFKGALPQITLGAQATYQSDVTQLPVEMPGVEPLSKDQYKAFVEVSQSLYHGGQVTRRRQIEESNADIEERRLDVELYQIKSRIDDLFFGAMMMQEQIAQSKLVRQDLQAELKRLQASIANGTALPSAADVLEVETLRLDQRMMEMQSAELSLRQLLGLFINDTITAGTVFKRPVAIAFLEPQIRRPELALFEVQKNHLTLSQGLLSATRKPSIDLFLQGGYGRPGLNMLKNEFDAFYIGGIRLNWRLSGYHTLKREREILVLRSRSIDVQKETFLFNAGLALNQYEIEINKLRRLIEVDDEIIALRTKVRKTAAVQLQEGVITPTDFVREVNAEDQAKQNRVLHETQLLAASAKYKFTTGEQ